MSGRPPASTRTWRGSGSSLIPEAAEHLHAKDRWYLFGGVLLYLLTTAVVYLLTTAVAGIAGRSPLKWYVGWVLPSVVVAVLAGVLGHLVPAWTLAVLAWAVLAWFESYKQARETLDPDAGDLETVCDHLVTVGHPEAVIGQVRSFVDKPPHPGAEWLVESA